MTQKIIGIVPAKKNSTALPGKNLCILHGKPLVQWTIEASLQSKSIDRTIVSSDANEILGLARNLGAETIKRPDALATSTASCESVMYHALETLNKTQEYMPEVLVLLQPTSPLRTAEDIDRAVQLYRDNHCSAVISGYELQRNPLKEFLVDEQGNLTAIRNNQDPFLPRQQLPRAFRPNGAIYIVQTEAFVETGSLLTEHTKPFFMDRTKSIDIDSFDDLRQAEKEMQKNRSYTTYELY